MPSSFPPVPQTQDISSIEYQNWLEQLRNTLGGTSVPFASLDFTGSNITSIVTRNHNDLTSKQGGSGSEFYHLSQADYNEVSRISFVTSLSANTNLSDAHKTVYVTATGKTITLPACSSARIGHDWTIILATTGYVDITRAGSDTIILPTNDTTIRLRTKGASLTVRCLTSSSWGII